MCLRETFYHKAECFGELIVLLFILFFEILLICSSERIQIIHYLDISLRQDLHMVQKFHFMSVSLTVLFFFSKRLRCQYKNSMNLFLLNFSKNILQRRFFLYHNTGFLCNFFTITFLSEATIEFDIKMRGTYALVWMKIFADNISNCLCVSPSKYSTCIFMYWV